MENLVQMKLNRYESEKLYVQSLLKDRPLIQSDIVKAFISSRKDAGNQYHGLACEISKSSLMRALTTLTDIAWTATRDRLNNALIFELLNCSFTEY